MTRSEEQVLGKKLQKIINKEVKSFLNDFNLIVVYFKMLSEKKDPISFFHSKDEERHDLALLISRLNELAVKDELSMKHLNAIKSLDFSYDGIQLLRTLSKKGIKSDSLMPFPEWDKTAQEFILRNQGLVKNLSRMYQSQGLEDEDLMQEGNMGLLRAVQKFNIKLSLKFSTYATLWVKQAMARGIQNKSRMIRYPAHIDNKLKKARSELWHLYQSNDRELKDSDYVMANKKAGFTDNEMMDISECSQVVSFFDPVHNNNEMTIGENISDIIEDTEIHCEKEQQSIAKNLIALLPSEQATVLEKRFGLFNTRVESLEEIAAEMNVSRETIRRLEKKATIQLSDYIAREGYTLSDFI